MNVQLTERTAAPPERIAAPRIVNADPRYPKAELIEPTTLGYLYVAAAVRPGPSPLVLPNAERSAVLVRLKELARELERIDTVVQATVFRAIVKPPTARSNSYLKERADSLRIANFDVIVLIQTPSPGTIRAVQATRAYEVLLDAVRSNAETVHVMAARNAKRIGDVDTTRSRRTGLFLFNHFAAADAGVMLELWEYLAGWYAAETGLDNSVAMVPLDGEPSDYAIVNWARWDDHPLRHFWRQLSKKSFWTYVAANLEANRAGSMPIYCRLA